VLIDDTVEIKLIAAVSLYTSNGVQVKLMDLPVHGEPSPFFVVGFSCEL